MRQRYLVEKKKALTGMEGLVSSSTVPSPPSATSEHETASFQSRVGTEVTEEETLCTTDKPKLGPKSRALLGAEAVKETWAAAVAVVVVVVVVEGSEGRKECE